MSFVPAQRGREREGRVRKRRQANRSCSEALEKALPRHLLGPMTPRDTSNSPGKSTDTDGPPAAGVAAQRPGVASGPQLCARGGGPSTRAAAGRPRPEEAAAGPGRPLQGPALRSRGPALTRAQVPGPARWDRAAPPEPLRDLRPRAARTPRRPLPHVPACHSPVLRARFWEPVPCREASADGVSTSLSVDGRLDLPRLPARPQRTSAQRARPREAQESVPGASTGDRWAAVGHARGARRGRDPGVCSASVLGSKVGILTFQSLL